MKRFGVMVAALLGGLVLVQGQYVRYIDATTNTVTLSNGDPLVAGTHYVVGQTWSSNEGLWDYRTGFANGSSIWQNAPAGQIDTNVPVLRVPISLSEPGQYAIHVYFWSDTSGWRIRAGLSLDTMTMFYHPENPASQVVQLYPDGGDPWTHPDVGAQYITQIGGYPIVGTPSPQGLLVSEGNRRLLQATLGSINISGPAEIAVFVGPDLNQTSSNERTWFDGVGYTFVPEPQSVAMLVMGLMGMAAYRTFRGRARRQ